MTLQANPEAIPFGIATAISGGLALFAWRRRALPTAPAFAVMMTGEAAWALFEAIELVIVDLPVKRLCFALRAAGATTTILGLMAFVLRYTGCDRWLEPRRFGALCAPSLALLAVAWTNPWHHRYWAGLENARIGEFWIAMPRYGPGFWAHFAYSYALTAVAAVLLVRAVVRFSGVFRVQASIMLFGVLFPWVVNIVDMTQVFGFIHVDTVAMAFAVTGLAFVPGLFRFRLLDLTPVAWAVVVKGMNDPVVVIDPRGRIVDWNPAAERLAGQESHRVLGVAAARTFRDWPALAARLARIGADGESTFELNGPDSARSSSFDARISRLGDRARPTGWVLVLRDITERKRAEAALRESEQRYRRLVETSPDAIVLSDLDSTILMANEQAAILYGAASTAELVGRVGFEFIAPEDRERAAAHAVECIGCKIVRNLEYHLMRKDGSIFPAEVSSSVVVDAEDRPKGFISTVRDITERKRAEGEIERRHRELAALNAVAAAVSSSLEMPEMLAALQGVMAGQLGIPGGAISFYDEAGDRLELEAAWGLPQDMLDAFRSIPVAGSPDERVVREKEAILRPDSRELGPLAALGLDASRLGWQVSLSVPLLAKGEVQGTLSLFGEAPEAFGGDRVAFFQAVGQEVGIAIHNARLFEQVRAGRERLQALSRRLVQVLEAERHHIARELHDEIGQDLTGLEVALAMAARAPAESRGATLDQAQELVDRLMTRVRDLSLDLRPAMLDDLGLLPALLWHFERYTAQTGIRVAFERAGPAGRFPPPVETAAYRIVQEALTNVTRHAAVGEVTVRLWANSHVLSLQIIDRGVGFDPASIAACGTTGGLSGMAERASLLAGQLRVESSPGAGTRVTAEWPLSRPTEGSGEGG